MAQDARLRVALEDRADALQLVRRELYDATGLTPEPDFQEIERPGELLIEVRLHDADGYTPAEVARMVTVGSPHLDVLSAWTEPVEPVEAVEAVEAVKAVEPAPRQPLPSRVIDLLQCEIPDLALRAHRDSLPTARWHHPSFTNTSHWLLAVPGMDSNGQAVVGICTRTGYYYRFSASEASSLALSGGGRSGSARGHGGPAFFAPGLVQRPLR